MLEKAADSHQSSAPRKSGAHFSRQKPSIDLGKYTPNPPENGGQADRTISRTKQWRHAEEASPKCTVVTGPIDLYTGGEGGRTPMRKLIPVNDRVLSNKREGVKDEEKGEQTEEGDGGSTTL